LVLKKAVQPDLDKRLEETLRRGVELASEKGITRRIVERAVKEVRHG